MENKANVKAVKFKRFHIYVTEAQYEELRAIEEKEGTTKAENIRSAIDLWMAVRAGVLEKADGRRKEGQPTTE